MAIVACQYELGLGNAMRSGIEWFKTYFIINDTEGANSCWVFLLRNLLSGVFSLLYAITMHAFPCYFSEELFEL